MTNLLCKIYQYSRLDVRLDKHLGMRRTLIVRGNSPEAKRSISRFIKFFFNLVIILLSQDTKI